MKALGEPSLKRRFAKWLRTTCYGLPFDFDEAEYLRLNPDVADANADPVRHFLKFGRKEGRNWKRPVPSQSLSHADADHQPDQSDTTMPPPDILWTSGALLPDPALIESCGTTNVIAYMKRYWAVPQALGPIDFRDEKVRSHPDIRSATTREEIIALIGKIGEQKIATTKHYDSRQNELSPPSSTPFPLTTPEALHEYAKTVGPQKLLALMIPHLRQSSPAIQSLDAWPNIAGPNQYRSVMSPEEIANGRQTTTHEVRTGHSDSFHARATPFSADTASGSRLFEGITPTAPHAKIISEHKFSKVADAPRRISVIYTYFEKESTILRSIESLMKQNWKRCGPQDVEIIVIDDGTPSRDIIDRLPEDIIYLWQRKIRFGSSRAKNTAARLANGEFLVFLDPDILVCAGYFDAMLDRFNFYGNRIVQCGYIWDYFFKGCPDPRTEFGVWERPDRPTRRFYQLAAGNLAISRRLYFETPGFDEDLIYGGVEDLLFGFQVSKLHDCAVLFNRNMETWHIPHPPGGAHLNVDRSWEIVKRKWPEFYTDYRENGSR